MIPTTLGGSMVETALLEPKGQTLAIISYDLNLTPRLPTFIEKRLN